MSMIIDLIIVIILALCVFFGYKNGLTKSVIKILSFVIALVVAAIFFKPVSNLIIDNTQIDENIKQSVTSLVIKEVEEEGKVSDDSNLPNAMVEYINNTVGEKVNEAKDAAVATVADTIATTAINVGVAIILFIVVRIALIFVSALSDLLTDLPLIKQFDKTGGVIYGLLKAALIIFILLSIISLLSPVIEQTGVVSAINKSYIGGFLYNNNILLNIIL